MSRFARWTSIALAASLALAIPATSHAQFGGLRKKVKDKIAGDPQPAAAPASGAAGDADAKARKDAWDHPVAISGTTLDNLAKGIKAEQATRATYASTPTSPLGRWNSYQAAKAKCAADQVQVDSAMARLQRKMMVEATAGHADAIQPIQDSIQKVIAAGTARNQQCSALQKPTFTSEDYTAIHAEEDKEDAAGAAASGLSPLVYARLKERVIAYVLLPNGWKATGYSADETQTLDAHRAELRKSLGDVYNYSGYRNPIGA